MRYDATLVKYQDYVGEKAMVKTKVQCLMKLLQSLISKNFTQQIRDKVEFWRKPATTTDVIRDTENSDSMLRQYLMVQKMEKGAIELKTWQRLAQAEFYDIYRQKWGDNLSTANKGAVKVRLPFHCDRTNS